jgi:cyclopropane fatty-acyl-phospholipid synthase-like methyltransferase
MQIPMDMVTNMHLYNARTRLVGYNQLLTTYKRHVDIGFEEHVRSKNLAQYMAIARARFNDGLYLTDVPQ